jgi:FkbM family methyltransferase
MPHDNWVRSLGLDSDGSLYVEVDIGIRLFDQCLNGRLQEATRIHPEALMKQENRHLYYCFLRTLKEIEGVIYNSAYDGDHSFQKGDIVVDAGARIGTFAAKASQAVGKEGKIVAIEPEPHNYACLLKNIEKNRLTNIIPVQKMLWSGEQRLDLYLSNNLSAHSAYCHEFYGPTGSSIRADAAALDQILLELGIGSVNFIKMDIEGSEIEALKGMRRTLASAVQLAIAAYHPVEGRFTHSVIVPQLEQLGFEAQYENGIVRARR